MRLLWPYSRVSLASIGIIWWVWDHTWISCALEQPEVLRSRVSIQFLVWQVLVASIVFYIKNVIFSYINFFLWSTVGSASTWPSRRVYFTRLLSTSGCSSAYDIQVWSHTHHILPIEAKEILKYGLRKLRNINFDFVKNLC